MSNYEDAKKIYIKHGGNYFFMDRGDEPLFEKYKSFNVPKELEQQWDKEIKEDYLYHIKNEKNMNMLRIYYSSIGGLFTRTNDIKGLIYLKDLLGENQKVYDTFTNLLLVETIFGQIKSFVLVDKAITLQIAKKLLNILKNLREQPISVSKDYYPTSETREGTHLSDKEIEKRIKDDIEEYTKKYEDIKNRTLEELFPHRLELIRK